MIKKKLTIVVEDMKRYEKLKKSVSEFQEIQSDSDLINFVLDTAYNADDMRLLTDQLRKIL